MTASWRNWVLQLVEADTTGEKQLKQTQPWAAAEVDEIRHVHIQGATAETDAIEKQFGLAVRD